MALPDGVEGTGALDEDIEVLTLPAHERMP